MQYPERVEEEQTVKVVENHEGGTWDRLATDPRSGHGFVSRRSGLLGSQDGEGAIFGNSDETS